MGLKRPRVLILAGGIGSRLRSVVADVPKPLADIQGRPFIEHLISFFGKQDFKDFVILAGYRGKMLRERLGNGRHLDSKIEVLIEPEPLGTGGAVRDALWTIDDKEFLLINGDSIIIANYAKWMESVRKPVSIAMLQVPDVSRYGAIQTNEHHVITSFAEKTTQERPGWINAGVYYFTREILRSIGPGKISLESDVFPKLVEQGRLSGFPLNGRFIDIGTPDSYELAKRELPSWLGEITHV